MKKLLPLLFLLSLNLTNISAQNVEEDYFNDGQTKHNLRMDLLHVAWGDLPFTSEYGLAYERNIGSKHAIGIRGAYLNHNVFAGMHKWEDAEGNRNGIFLAGASAEVTYKYFMKNTSSGIFSGFTTSFSKALIYDKLNPQENKIIPQKTTFAAILGVRKNVDEMLFDLSIGVGLKHRNWSYGSSGSGTGNSIFKEWWVERRPSTKIAIPLNVSVGYAF